MPQGMSSVLLARLQSGKAAAERLLGILQAFSSAEAAYARAMAAAARVQLVGECDGPNMRAAMEKFKSVAQFHFAFIFSTFSQASPSPIINTSIAKPLDHLLSLAAV